MINIQTKYFGFMNCSRCRQPSNNSLFLDSYISPKEYAGTTILHTVYFLFFINII